MSLIPRFPEFPDFPEFPPFPFPAASMDGAWDHFLDFPPFPFPAAASLKSRVDETETREAHVFKVDVPPGLRKEEVKVEVHDGRDLLISSSSSGKFARRRIRLPKDARTEEIKASVENGVLTVSVPKTTQVKKRNVRAIKIS